MSKPVSDLGTTLFIAHAGRPATFTALPWLPFGLRAMSLPHTFRMEISSCLPFSSCLSTLRVQPGSHWRSPEFRVIGSTQRADPLFCSLAGVVQQTRHLPSGPPKRAKPAAEREVKGEASLLAEPRADRTVGPLPAKPAGV